MADERLSKLQKWILEKCYEQGEKKVYGFWRGEFIRKYCEEAKGSTYSISSVQVTITRSIRNLAFKEYVVVFSRNKENPFIDVDDVLPEKLKVGLGKNIKMFLLTEKGIAKAEKLLNVKK